MKVLKFPLAEFPAALNHMGASSVRACRSSHIPTVYLSCIKYVYIARLVRHCTILKFYNDLMHARYTYSPGVQTCAYAIYNKPALELYRSIASIWGSEVLLA